VRVAVIGAGSMGGMHASMLAGMPDVDGVLIVEADAARATEVAEQTGAWTATFEEGLREADAVIVATPPELHAAEVTAALEAGRHVLCEKPLTDTLASSIALTERIEATGAHVELGFQRRHDVAFAAARAAIEGRLHLVRLTANDPVFPRDSIPSTPPPDVAPIFRDSSIHDFDLARWLSGQEVTEVLVEAGRHDGTRTADPREIDSAVVAMRLSGGALAVLEASWLQPVGYDVRIELLSEGAAVSAGWTERTPVTPVESAPPADPWSGYLDRFEPAYRAELAAFLSCCRGVRPPVSSARDGLEAMRIAAAATRSFSEGRRVGLDEIDGLARREVA
jgi:myo-inositol 2-dehydrogenase / D-chiro-inositol 1-dehydrogenase